MTGHTSPSLCWRSTSTCGAGIVPFIVRLMGLMEGYLEKLDAEIKDPSAEKPQLQDSL